MSTDSLRKVLARLLQVLPKVPAFIGISVLLLLVIALGLAIPFGGGFLSSKIWQLCGTIEHTDIHSEPYLALFVIAILQAAAYTVGLIVGALWLLVISRREDRSPAGDFESPPDGGRPRLTLKPGDLTQLDIHVLDSHAVEISSRRPHGSRLTPQAESNIRARAMSLPLVVAVLVPLTLNLLLTEGWLRVAIGSKKAAATKMVAPPPGPAGSSGTSAASPTLTPGHAGSALTAGTGGAGAPAASPTGTAGSKAPKAMAPSPLASSPDAQKDVERATHSEMMTHAALRYTQVFLWFGTLMLVLLALTASAEIRLGRFRWAVLVAPFLMVVALLCSAYLRPGSLFAYLLAAAVGVAYQNGTLAIAMPRDTFTTSTSFRFNSAIVAWMAIPMLIALFLSTSAGPADPHVPLQQLAWPIAAIVAFVIFKPTIERLIPNVRTVKAFGTEWLIDPAALDKRTDLRLPLTSFQELMKVASDLIRKTSRTDTVRIVAYTPALGYLARTQEEFETLAGEMKRCGDRIKIACLKPDQLSVWHATFVDKRTVRGLVDPPLIKRANDEAASILKCIKHVVHKNYDDLPDYYAFANREKAIIVVPFSLPKLQAKVHERLSAMIFAGAFTEEQLESADPGAIEKVVKEPRVVVQDTREQRKTSPVEMFGIVTNDPQIVRYVNEILDDHLQPP